MLRLRLLAAASVVVTSLACTSAPKRKAEDAHAAAPRAPAPNARDDRAQQVRARAPAPVAPAASSEAPISLRFGDSATPRELAPIFPDTTYDSSLPTPDSSLRQPLGTFTAHHAEILAYLRKLESASPRVRLTTMGRTHEGRELVYAVIGLPENLQRLDELRARLAKLADPRTTNDAEVEDLVKDTPAFAWLGYSIHGDETSGSDASMAVAYHLAAGTSADVTELLKNLVVVIDPSQNPDGRERVLSMFEQSMGYVPNLDSDSMSRGRWPYGRGNHYLFDMNRDWIWGTQPETRARWAAIQSFHPQLLVDAHEMGSSDTFLFYPATDPFTPFFPEHTLKWWQRFGADQARAFDAHGWSYYTREWADSWYPGYTDSWGTFLGAVGILYEQARYGGQALRRASGEIATYRDAVARQATGSLANLRTLAQNRVEMLRDYHGAKKRNVAAETPGNERMFVLARGRRPEREAAFVRMLAAQGIECFTTQAEFEGKNVDTTLAGRVAERKFAAGSVLIPARQPLGPMVKAFLAFDPRYDKASLARERKELERKQQSKAYDVTAWSPAHAWDLDAFWCDALDIASTRVNDLDAPATGVVALERASDPIYAWAVDGESDAAVAFAARALELGVQLNVSDEPFQARGKRFPRGSLLVRRVENADGVAEKVEQAARAARASVYAVGTARSSDDTPDLGGQHFTLLARPRVAVLSNTPVSSSDFGSTWHLIDNVLGLPMTLVDAQRLGGYDLRRYNVLVLPDGGLGSLVHDHAEELSTWVRGGGTLIASGGSAADLCDKELGFTSTRLRQDALDKLDEFTLAVQREREAGRTEIDESLLWDGKPTPKPGEAKKEGDAKDESLASKEDKARRDAFQRTFSPQGAILRGEVDPDSWLTFGCAEELPVLYGGSDVFLSQRPARTAVRFATAERLRLSGLLWPEARERLADSGYAIVERKGAGQVILFASPPDFRNWCRATMRLLANAIVYGPGAGANQPSAW